MTNTFPPVLSAHRLQTGLNLRRNVINHKEQDFLSHRGGPRTCGRESPSALAPSPPAYKAVTTFVPPGSGVGAGS